MHRYSLDHHLSRWSSVLGIIVYLLFLLASSLIVLPTAQADEMGGDDNPRAGLHHESKLQIRVEPPGLNYTTQTAFRLPLRDGSNILFEDRYLDLGVSTDLSPTFLWGGPYVEILPVAVLKLRATAQFKGYFGTFGHLHVTEEGDGSQQARRNTRENDLTQTGRGFRVELQATPQILIKQIAFLAESSIHRMIHSSDHPYYEPYFGLIFEPTELVIETNPTLGYLFGSRPETGYLFLGARWERTMARRSGHTQDKFGIAFNAQMPSDWFSWGSPVLAGLVAVRRKTPDEPDLAPFLGFQFILNF